MDAGCEFRNEISGGVLAGGLGSRVGGADKGWLRYGDRALIERVAGAMRPQVSELLISANRHLDAYARLCDRVVRDDGAPGQGPLAGMVRLLEACPRPWLLCVPCDVPELPVDLGSQLLHRALASGADLAVLRDAQGWHPTFCLLRRELAADARAAFDVGERAPRRWLARHRVAEWTGWVPVNLNTLTGIHALESAT